MLASNLKDIFEGVVEGRLPQAAWREAVLNQDVRPKLDQLNLISKVRKVPVEVLLDFPLMMVKLALAQPLAIDETLDKLAASWQEKWALPLPELPAVRHEVPGKLWELFWDNLETSGATPFFVLAGQYPSYLDDRLRDDYARLMLSKTGAYRETILDHLTRPDYTLESLRDYPEDTLGYVFYHQLVDNNLGLEALSPNKYTWVDTRIEFVGRRYLQTHDIWHAVLGYGVKPYEEVALQVVNLAQIGGAFAAYLPAMLTCRFLFFNPSQVTYFLDLICQSWLHGRQTPPLMPIKWEEMWDWPLSEVRERYGIHTLPNSNQYLYR